MRRGWACLVVGAIMLLGCRSADEPEALPGETTSTTTTSTSTTTTSTNPTTTTTPIQTTAPPETILDGGDPFLAVVEELPVEVAIFQTADEVVVARSGATSTVPVPVEEWAWSDGAFVYETVGWPDPV